MIVLYTSQNVSYSPNNLFTYHEISATVNKYQVSYLEML